MGTRSPCKPTRWHWLFRVTIDFLTKAMTSLISPLVCHVTQMGSLAAGPDNNSSGYESEIGWIKHTAHFSTPCNIGNGCRAPSLNRVENKIERKNQSQRYLCLRTHKDKQALQAHSPFSVQFKLNLRKMRDKSTDRFSAGFSKQKQQWKKDYFHFNPGAPA